jgi:hemolysin III
MTTDADADAGDALPRVLHTDVVDRGIVTDRHGFQRPRFRGVSHQWGFFIALIASTAMVISAPDGRATFAAVAYGFCLCAMLGVSALYHRVAWGTRAGRRMNRLDHSTIFLAIAGTYTPIALIGLRGWIEVTLLVFVWGGSIGGIVAEWMPFEPPRGYITTVYVAIGWVAVIAIPQIWSNLGVTAFVLIAIGGGLYTIGAFVLAFRRPDPAPLVFGYHEVFHVFVVLAATLHFVAITFFVLPKG